MRIGLDDETKFRTIVIQRTETALINCYALALHGHVVAQLVEALRYKPQGRESDSRLCHWNFPLT